MKIVFLFHLKTFFHSKEKGGSAGWEPATPFTQTHTDAHTGTQTHTHTHTHTHHFVEQFFFPRKIRKHQIVVWE